jgi:hypothetical protein
VYKKDSGDTAAIRGMILGGPCDNPCSTAYATKWSVVRDHLNVTIH